LDWRTKNLAWYSQESIETITSSTTPSGAALDLFASYNIVVVFINDHWGFNLSMVSIVITLMAAPRSIKVWGTMIPSMCTSTIGLPESRYFGKITL